MIENSDYLRAWFGNGIETKLSLKKVSPEHISFTVGDSGADYQKNGKVDLLTLDELCRRLAEYESFDAFIKAAGRNYVEAQLWSDRYVRRMEG